MKISVTEGTNGMGKGVAKDLAGIENQIHAISILCRSNERGEATLNELVAAATNRWASETIATGKTQLEGTFDPDTIRQLKEAAEHDILAGLVETHFKL